MKKIQIIGNITKDAEIRNFGNKNVINFSIATNEKYKDANGNQIEKAYYYRCSLWRENNLKIAEFLTKGIKVFIEGRSFDTEIYQDKNGEYKSFIKINIDNIELLSSKSNIQNSTNNNTHNTSSQNESITTNDSFLENIDDLPF